MADCTSVPLRWLIAAHAHMPGWTSGRYICAHTQHHHSLSCIINHKTTKVFADVFCLCFMTAGLVQFLFRIYDFTTSQFPSVFGNRLISWGYVFLSQCVCWSFLHRKHPVYCFSAHSSSTLFSQKEWSHQKELVVSRFSSWGQQKVEWFSEAQFLHNRKSASYSVLSHSL